MNRYTLKVPYKDFQEECKTLTEVTEYLKMMQAEGYKPEKIMLFDNASNKILKVGTGVGLNWVIRNTIPSVTSTNLNNKYETIRAVKKD